MTRPAPRDCFGLRLAASESREPSRAFARDERAKPLVYKCRSLLDPREPSRFIHQRVVEIQCRAHPAPKLRLHQIYII